MVDRAIRRRSVSQSIADDLLAVIRTGELRPGDRVEARPGLGTTVLASDSADAGGQLLISRRLTDDAIDDLYEFRDVRREPQEVPDAADIAVGEHRALGEARRLSAGRRAPAAPMAGSPATSE